MRLAILDDIEDVALKLADWDSLGPQIKIDVFRDNIKEETALAKRLLPYDILVIMRERTRFPRSLIEKLTHLKLLVTTGARNLAIDMAACQESGITVCGTASSKTAPAELAWALILSCLRKIPQLDRTVRDGRWGDGIGSGLASKTLGVLGLGKLGIQVTRVALAFGMNVIAWSQNLTPEKAEAAGACWVEKDEFFSAADIITIHLVLSDRTRGLVGARELGLMKPSAYLINTSRGPIVDEEALIAALTENRIAGAGLDVFETEPLPPDHPFLRLPNTVMTPHVGYVCREGFQIYFRHAKEDVAAWLAGKPVRMLQP
ncbi:MAG: D-2-hydroxyacid dehydrogenase family protein [Desulfobacterales bacterium]|nr:D-2-hydroxyacid dehydrogenase family protein [Desulfobacterales bacterium]